MHRSSMSNMRSARATGAVIFVVGAGLSLLLFRLVLTDYSGQTVPFIITKASVVSVTPGTEKIHRRTYHGENICYRYVVEDIRYEHKFFRRQFSLSDYHEGQIIEIIYRQDDPSQSWVRYDSWFDKYVIGFVMVVTVLLSCVGISMMIAGRDFLHDWKKERNPWQ